MHARLRGSDRSAIFFGDTDKRLFLDPPAEHAAAASVGVHAYPTICTC
jgi:hypothetical protein